MHTDDYFSARATGAIPAKTIVKFTGNPDEVAPATAATDPLAGVVDLGATLAGQMVDVAYGDVCEVVAGGAIAAGDPLTANAAGRAVAAVKVAGQTVRVIGFAKAAAVDGDIVDFIVAPSLIVG
jgi:hypothetical protein